MQVGLLPAAPISLPGGVKVARRFVKPHGVGASPTLAAIFQGVLSVADGLAWNEEDGSAILSTLTISGRQADISWLHLSRKQDPLSAETGALPVPSANLTINQRKSHEACQSLPKPFALL